jgi:hypothetical protein
MKYPLYLLAICVSLFSCKTIKLGTPPSSTPEPFVQLKNGEVIKPEARNKGTVAPNKKKDALVVDGRKVDKSSVAFYSDGDGTYAATSDDGFAKKIAEGKINVYNKVYDVYYSSYNSTTHTYNSGMRTVAHYYIQDSNSKYVSKLNYDNLYQMIPTAHVLLVNCKGTAGQKLSVGRWWAWHRLCSSGAPTWRGMRS